MSNNLFHDYYEDLQVSPNADADTINRVYRLLARKWHPDNVHTGDPDKFNRINEAYHILSNPQKRAEYDAGYENQQTTDWRSPYNAAQTLQSTESDLSIRYGILSVLYAARRKDTDNPSIGLWRLEQLLGWPEKEISFHVWYLKEKNWISRSETGGFTITVEGADAFEIHKSSVQSQRLLTENASQAAH
jgi:curved DNA-binding protein CbpA